METEKIIICEYCNKTITKKNRIRHEISKACINSQSKKQNFSCLYCDYIFTRNDTKNDHEKHCKFKDKYYKLSNEIELKNKEIEKITELKNKEIEMITKLITELKDQNYNLSEKIEKLEEQNNIRQFEKYNIFRYK